MSGLEPRDYRAAIASRRANNLATRLPYFAYPRLPTVLLFASFLFEVLN